MNCSSLVANGCFQWHGFLSTLWACSSSAQDAGKAHSLGLFLFTPCSHQQKNLSFKSGWFTLTPTNSTLHLPLLCTVSWKLLRDSAHGTGTWFHHERHCQEMEGGRKVRLGHPCPQPILGLCSFARSLDQRPRLLLGGPLLQLQLLLWALATALSSQGVIETHQGPALCISFLS